jgi:hypothetical protein
MFSRFLVVLLRPLEHGFFRRASLFWLLPIGRQESPVDNGWDKNLSSFVITEGSGILAAYTAVRIFYDWAAIKVYVALLD